VSIDTARSRQYFWVVHYLLTSKPKAMKTQTSQKQNPAGSFLSLPVERTSSKMCAAIVLIMIAVILNSGCSASRCAGHHPHTGKKLHAKYSPGR